MIALATSERCSSLFAADKEHLHDVHYELAHVDVVARPLPAPHLHGMNDERRSHLD